MAIAGAPSGDLSLQQWAGAASDAGAGSFGSVGRSASDGDASAAHAQRPGPHRAGGGRAGSAAGSAVFEALGEGGGEEEDEEEDGADGEGVEGEAGAQARLAAGLTLAGESHEGPDGGSGFHGGSGVAEQASDSLGLSLGLDLGSAGSSGLLPGGFGDVTGFARSGADGALPPTLAGLRAAGAAAAAAAGLGGSGFAGLHPYQQHQHQLPAVPGGPLGHALPQPPVRAPVTSLPWLLAASNLQAQAQMMQAQANALAAAGSAASAFPGGGQGSATATSATASAQLSGHLQLQHQHHATGAVAATPAPRLVSPPGLPAPAHFSHTGSAASAATNDSASPAVGAGAAPLRSRDSSHSDLARFAMQAAAGRH
jgi:hypothetical protein